eukprot:223954-Prymnesium_polylepis.1
MLGAAGFGLGFGVARAGVYAVSPASSIHSSHSLRQWTTDEKVSAPVAHPKGGHQSQGGLEGERRAQEAAGAGEALSGAAGGSEGCKEARRAP